MQRPCGWSRPGSGCDVRDDGVEVVVEIETDTADIAARAVGWSAGLRIAAGVTLPDAPVADRPPRCGSINGARRG